MPAAATLKVPAAAAPKVPSVTIPKVPALAKPKMPSAATPKFPAKATPKMTSATTPKLCTTEPTKYTKVLSDKVSPFPSKVMVIRKSSRNLLKESSLKKNTLHTAIRTTKFKNRNKTPTNLHKEIISQEKSMSSHGKLPLSSAKKTPVIQRSSERNKRRCIKVTPKKTHSLTKNMSKKSKQAEFISPEKSSDAVTPPSASASPVRLSECPIKLAVFRSPPSHSASLANENTTHLSGRGPSTNDSFASINTTANISSISNSSQLPRLSKREELALALRKGQINALIETKKLKNMNTTFTAPAIVKKSSKIFQRTGLTNEKLSSKKEPLFSTTSFSSTVSSKNSSKKLPVWANVKSTGSSRSIFNSSRKPRRLSKVSREMAYEFSFTSEDDTTKPKKKKRIRKTKTTKEKPKLTSTKSKLLTTDPEFHKGFPAMFGVKSFYAETIDSRCGRAAEAASNTDITTATANDSDLELCEMADDNFIPDHDDNDFVSVENEVVPCALNNSDNSVPNIIVTCAAAPGYPPPVKGISDTINNNVVIPTAALNKRSEGHHANSSLPTPHANRILSKLVGGTSTPFAVPAMGVRAGAYPTQVGAAIPLDPLVPAATVSEQIEECFGFDDTDDDSIGDNSLNLSPVSRSTVSVFNAHQYSTTSILSDVGIVDKDVAPTRFVPSRPNHHGGFSSVSNINSSGGGLSRSSRVVQSSSYATKNTAQKKPKNVSSIMTATTSKLGNNNTARNSHPKPADKTTMANTLLTNKNNSSLCKNVIKETEAVSSSTSPNFNESRLFDAVDSPVKSAGLDSLQSAELPAAAQPTLPTLPCSVFPTPEVAGTSTPTPEKSFSKVCL